MTFSFVFREWETEVNYPDDDDDDDDDEAADDDKISWIMFISSSFK